MKCRAWLYCRVANGLDENTSVFLEGQKLRLERFCAEHDMMIAGTSLVTGNGADELRELLRCGIEDDSFDVIVTVSTSRLARATPDLFQIVNDLKQHGKGLCAVKDDIILMPDFSLDKDHQHDEGTIEMGGQSL